jgi:hypothetical protein
MASSEQIHLVGNRDSSYDEQQLSLFGRLPVVHSPMHADVRAERRPISYVNHLQCVLVRDHLKVAGKWSEAADTFALNAESKDIQLRALVYLVSVCDRLNWDFVLGPLARELSKVTDVFDSQAVRGLSQTDFRRAFGDYKRTDGGIKFSQKLRTLKTVACHVSTNDSVTKLLHSSSILGEEGAQAIIQEIPAYSADPVSKKCNALLHEIVRRKLIGFSDPDAIEPAIDYHIMRLYLRTGRVEIRDGALSDRLVHRGPVRIERITEIRRVVAEAMRYAAWVNGMTISRLNDLEWLFARKACRRDGVWCFGGINCPLEAVCPSAKLNPIRMITEPESRHGHY